MARKFQTLRGFRDLLPGETEHWQRFEAGARELLRRYGFREIRPPMLEATELFVRSVGADTDIVGKEMFVFGDGEESLCLRPEVTAAVCRAYIQHGLDRAGLSRLYYLGPCFRKERPQKGRYRQFHQVGVEVLGEQTPETDVEAIVLALETVRLAGVTDAELVLNTIGDESCRPAYREALVGFLERVEDRLCPDCRTRLRTNPMRVLDCKVEADQALYEEAPTIGAFLTPAARGHFEQVLAQLAELGVAATVDERLVRGLDYYVHTTFEIRARSGLGAQNAVLGGGRYDGLVRELGGSATPGLGWAAGIERLLIAGGRAAEEAPAAVDAYVVTLGDAARGRALPLVQALRAEGLATLWDPAGHGLGGQMKRAGRSGARFAVLIGEEELARGTATIKDLVTGHQEEGPGAAAALAEHLRRAAAATGHKETRHGD
jgi:histidyl-tRNA synthetase